MKKFKTTLLLFVSLFSIEMALGQDESGYAKPAAPCWYSDKGYWVVESNLKTPDKSIVRFYNSAGKLIYTEKVEGVVVNCKKRKTLMKLKRVLEKVVTDYDANGTIKTGEEIAAYFSGRRKNG